METREWVGRVGIGAMTRCYFDDDNDGWATV